MDVKKTIIILDGITPAVEAIPVAGPGLVVMLSVAKQVCLAVDGARINREAYDQLAQEVAKYASAVSKAIQSDSRFTPGLDHAFNKERNNLMDGVEELTSVFREVLKLIEDRREDDKKRRRKLLGRVRQRIFEAWHKDDDAEDVKTLARKIESNIKVFNIGNEVRGLDTLARIEHEVKAIAAAHPDLLKQELAPILSARFDWHGAPEGCLPDTRVNLLDRVRGWILDQSASSPYLFALTGLAGTGKTTVAQSICIEFDRKQTTVSFFASRSFAERRDPENIVRTISYQLATQHTAIQSAVFAALHNGRDVLTRPLREQVESLIISPLRALTNSTSRILIVIDALDECIKVGRRESGELIPLIAAGIRHLSGRVKLLVTSREEPRIMEMFRDLGLDTEGSLVRLQNIEDTFVKKDVRAYFTHHFRHVSRNHGVQDIGTWPSEADLDFLVELTGKLFVFAALLVRIVSAPRINPKKRLEEILRPFSLATPSSGFQFLDELYLDVLKKATSVTEDLANEEVLERVRNTVGTLVLSQSPLSANALSCMLEEEPFLVWEDVEHLSAVLVVPDSPHKSVTIFHPSFRDYVLSRCTNGHFRVDPADFSLLLARCCLGVMNRGLKKDICNIGDPSIMNEDVDNLNEQINTVIPLELRYACEYWMIHLSEASHSNKELLDDLKTFCDIHLLHWIEALSLLDKLSAASLHLPSAIMWCKRDVSAVNSSISSLLEDAERMVLAFHVPIRAGALQVYSSALVFIPKCKLYQTVKREALGAMKLVSERPGAWPALRQTIEGHTASVLSVSFSPDGSRIASGSGDKSVRVWDAVGGRELARLNGHTDMVWSVAFSPDGTCIVSGSNDQTVRIWDSVSGCELARLNGHTDKVQSVTFSADGTRIASGSHDKTVRIWNAVTGYEVAKLNGHTETVTSVAFSPDGTRIASGSDDKTVRVWDTISTYELTKLSGHTDLVTSVAFSPNGAQIASGSWDKSVQVWNAISGSKVTQLNGHTDRVRSVAFSPDGTHIASGSYDNTVRVWDVASSHEIAQLNGHTHWVFSVAFSPDRDRIASGSCDDTVRVWDTIASWSKLSQHSGHTKSMRSAALSPDSTRIATASDDTTVWIWDAISGHELVQLIGHVAPVWCVIFSPDGMRIASGSSDRTIRIWDALSGCELVQLNGHTDRVLSVAFSPNGTQITSGSDDMTVRIWDAVSSCELAQLDGHSASIASVLFSESGTEVTSTDIDNNQRVWYADTDFPTSTSHIHLSLPISSTFSLLPTFSFDNSSGWLVQDQSQENKPRYLCWIPSERRGMFQILNNFVVFGSPSGIVTILSISHL